MPSAVSALPGKVRLYPYQRSIADAISDPTLERITMVKAARVGFTTLLTGAVGSFVINEPSPILALLPTEDDCRRYMVMDIEPIFEASPSLAGALKASNEVGERNTLLTRRFAGGALKIVAAKAPRNLRAHTARVLIVDEADAMEVGAEGDPILLGENRTMTFVNRKIILGSTPVFADTSHVLRAYGNSDQRVFEVPCPSCGAFTEIKWAHIVWPDGKPDEAKFECPHCNEKIEERFKLRMVTQGQWRITRPEVKKHAGFRLNALVSLVPHANWAALARLFLEGKDEPTQLQAFTNTLLAEGWSTPSLVDEGLLASRAEPWDLDHMPIDVLVLTVGIDVQDDRLECTVCGWTKEGDCLILGHHLIWGSFADDTTWDECDEFLRGKWPHPYGGMIGISAACIDAGDGDHFQSVMSFCVPKVGRRIFPIKGMFGARPSFQLSKGKAVKDRLVLVGVDTLKNLIFEKLQRARGIRFSHSLEPVYYEQLASERRVVRYSRGMPVRRFERVSSRQRAEALDALVYATAARSGFTPNWDTAEAKARAKETPRKSLKDLLPH